MEPNIILQRYMNLPKFMYLLQEKALFLPKMSKFSDHLEGGLTARDYFARSNEAAIIDLALNALFPTGQKPDSDRQRQLSRAEALQKTLMDRTFETPFGSYNCEEIEKLFVRCREWLYVSCWHKSPHECAAMWSLYGGDKNSICLFTSMEKIQSQVYSKESNQNIIFQEISYLDHGTAPFQASSLAPFISKAMPFSFEKEVRVICYDPAIDLKVSEENPENGKRLDIRSLNELIDSIVVSPTADAWFVALIKNLCSSYKLDAKVNESSLKTNRIDNFFDAFSQLSWC